MKRDENKQAPEIGKKFKFETVDFSDPNRPKTCIEVDFPIEPINKIATIEGKGSGALKPVYQVMKWWARRRSTVFRSILLSAVIKAPEDEGKSSKMVWDAYYGNHQSNKAFQKLRIADVFMGGGTTLIEGSRLGFEMHGIDLNPVAWLTVKNSSIHVNPEDLATVYQNVKSKAWASLYPFFTCKCPHSHKAKLLDLRTNKYLENATLTDIKNGERKHFSYVGPELTYTFWAKHGPCQVTGCGHRTPILTNPVVAAKMITIRYWDFTCRKCNKKFDIEKNKIRLSPKSDFVIGKDEKPFVSLDSPPQGTNTGQVKCPHCKENTDTGRLSQTKKKKIELTVFIHPDWIKGEANKSPSGESYGGGSNDSIDATKSWNNIRASKCRLIEFRGPLPDEFELPQSKAVMKTGKKGGTVPGRSKFECGACGTAHDVLRAVKASGDTGPVAMYAFQGYCPTCDEMGDPMKGKFISAVDDAHNYNNAIEEWAKRKDQELKEYWPKSELPYGFMTHKLNGGIPNHGYTHWWKMFNPRQLLVHAEILKSICEESLDQNEKLLMLGVFQQYLRNQNMFCFWNIQRALEPMFSNNNFHPKATAIENSIFSGIGRGDFKSSFDKAIESLNWSDNPWEILANDSSGHSEKVDVGDKLLGKGINAKCSSATELTYSDETLDIVVTDPPFGDLLHYSELSDFFYVWLRLALKSEFPEYFENQYAPKSVEVVSNRAREPDDPDGFYQRLLTTCWKEVRRVLKPGGLLVFTFHHSEDAPWVSVLESLFDAGFYLEATYPIRSDETKGSGEFGSRKIEYDIIHVCRKKETDPTPVSWAKVRRELLRDVSDMKVMIENHYKAGLPEADLKVIKCGKALEYYSKHYNQVYIENGRIFTVKEALTGVTQFVLDDQRKNEESPPSDAEPLTRHFLRIFYKVDRLPRDQVQKMTRWSGVSPSDFLEKGWCIQENKEFILTSPFEIAESWVGKHRSNMSRDLDQALFLVGACYEGSGINLRDTLNNPNFRVHPAIGPILNWLAKYGGNSEIRKSSMRADGIYSRWIAKNKVQVDSQLKLFEDVE